jgi:hypothetical protein
MATIMFIVKATIPSDKEAAFNRWYNEEHVSQALQFPGMVSAHRYKLIDGEDKYQYLAMYELKDEATYRSFVASDHMKTLRAEYDAHFPMSERARLAYAQVWP